MAVDEADTVIFSSVTTSPLEPLQKLVKSASIQLSESEDIGFVQLNKDGF